MACAYEVAARVFGPNYYEARVGKDRLLALEPPTDSRDVIIALDGSEVVGVVRIVDREAEAGSTFLKVGGITSVAVRPDARGTGCGRRLMNVAIERSRARRDVLSIAFARRAVDGFYWRLGYVGLGCHPRVTVTVPSNVDRADAGRYSRGFEAAAAEMYATAYDETYRGQPLRFKRPTSWWATAGERLRALASDGFVTVVRDARPVGYFVHEGGVVIEAASLPGEWPAVRHVVLGWTAGGEVGLALSPRHPLVRMLTHFNHTTCIRQSWDGGHLVRVLDAGPFVRANDAGLRAEAHAAWADVDTASHDAARSLLLRWAGAGPDAPAQPTAPSACFPVWSRIDEF